jgi:hypothetical protein
MQHFKPTSDYNLDKIIATLDLTGYCKRNFGSKQRVKTIARNIRKTVHNFQCSADKEITEDHVFCRTKLRMKIKPSQYISWATEFFGKVREKCFNLIHGVLDQSDIDISHDGYLKVAQLEELEIPHDYIIIDEAQDMTACQADLFWGQRQRASKRIYLFGDIFQQVYGFLQGYGRYNKSQVHLDRILSVWKEHRVLCHNCSEGFGWGDIAWAFKRGRESSYGPGVGLWSGYLPN